MSARLALTVAPRVQAALDEGQPVVALESTIISHGLPRPRNLEVALELEAMLRAAGVVPATVGVPAGRPTVGLDQEQLETLATSAEVAKVGVRELPIAVATSRHAATTVAYVGRAGETCRYPCHGYRRHRWCSPVAPARPSTNPPT